MLSPVKTTLSRKLKNKAYRTEFFRGRAQDEIAFSLRNARKKRRLTQPELEKLSGMKQSAISRIEQATYGKWNFQSLLTIADALDLRVRVEFDYAEDVIKEYEQRETGEVRYKTCTTQLFHGAGITSAPNTVYVNVHLADQGSNPAHFVYQTIPSPVIEPSEPTAPFFIPGIEENLNYGQVQ